MLDFLLENLYRFLPYQSIGHLCRFRGMRLCDGVATSLRAIVSVLAKEQDVKK